MVDDTGPMGVAVRFLDGPAGGQTRQYDYLAVPLPSLYWADETGVGRAVYRLAEPGPAADGVWRYQLVDETGPAAAQLPVAATCAAPEA